MYCSASLREQPISAARRLERRTGSVIRAPWDFEAAIVSGATRKRAAANGAEPAAASRAGVEAGTTAATGSFSCTKYSPDSALDRDQLCDTKPRWKDAADHGRVPHAAHRACRGRRRRLISVACSPICKSIASLWKINPAGATRNKSRRTNWSSTTLKSWPRSAPTIIVTLSGHASEDPCW
jgi:hypothetical protein